MRSTRCSRLVAGAVVAALVATLVATPVAAVSTDVDGLPADAEVGSEIEVTYTLTDLYEDGVNEWTLRGSTELTGVSWTVSKRKLSGDVVRESYGGASFETSVSAAEDVDRVTVRVTGTVPAVEAWRYEPPERFLATRLVRVAGENENELGRWQVHHYTEESSEARAAIESARASMGDDPPEDAERSLEQAISAYEGGNFPNAIANAEDAERAAESARESRQRLQLLLYGAIGVVALLAVFGGIYYYQSRRDSYSQLR